MRYKFSSRMIYPPQQKTSNVFQKRHERWKNKTTPRHHLDCTLGEKKKKKTPSIFTPGSFAWEMDWENDHSARNCLQSERRTSRNSDYLAFIGAVVVIDRALLVIELTFQFYPILINFSLTTKAREDETFHDSFRIEKRILSARGVGAAKWHIYSCRRDRKWHSTTLTEAFKRQREPEYFDEILPSAKP